MCLMSIGTRYKSNGTSAGLQDKNNRRRIIITSSYGEKPEANGNGTILVTDDSLPWSFGISISPQRQRDTPFRNTATTMITS